MNPEPNADSDAGYLAGLRHAREVVARQADLPSLVHFDRPSDFRKGVLSCLMALDVEIRDCPTPPGATAGGEAK